MPKKTTSQIASSKKKPTANIAKASMVAICGGAGSLSAYENFFVNLPLDAGLIYLVVQRTDPRNPNLLPELIRRNTKLPVTIVSENQTLTANHIYISSTEYDISLKGSKVILKKADAPPDARMPFDSILASLAAEWGSNAAAILLSGTGTDGAEGLRALKLAGGTTICQLPSTATYDSMPQSAIDTGLVDFILPVEDMAEKLLNHLKNLSGIKPKLLPEEAVFSTDSMHQIFGLIKAHTGHDFSKYKQNTISRRIERRMSTHQIRKLADYVTFLHENKNEITLLFKEMLIGVTNFFRDKETFEVLLKQHLPFLIESKEASASIRIWVPGCSTGEEAYSLTIILHELLKADNILKDYKIQVFATDIDQDAIDKARIGVYPNSIEEHVSEARLRQYFTKKGTTYQVKKEIRDCIVFAVQSVIKDPPFTKLDMVSCRNMLIYLDAELQKKLMMLFHYTLNTNGFLLLGSSETIGSFSDLFAPVDSKQRIFRRKDTPSSFVGMTQFTLPNPAELIQVQKEEISNKHRKELDFMGSVQRVLLENFAPPSIVVNIKGDILYVNGHTGRFLELSPGQAVLNIVNMAREGLRFELMSAIQEVSILKKTIEKKNLRIKADEGYILVDLIVKPFSESDILQELIFVIFKEHPDTRPMLQNLEKAYTGPEDQSKVEQLEKELLYTKRYLQNTIEEMESSLEELTLTNEESQSTNEELQSANEELMTSKEELQSLNEELITVNSELQSKMDEFSQVNNDLKNLIDSTEIATIFLDNNLIIKRFTNKATKVVNLISSDLGRPVTDIVSNLNYSTLAADVKEVLDTLVFKEIEVSNINGHWYTLRITPYRTIDNFIGGVVITFIDTTDTKALRTRWKYKKELTNVLFDTLREAIVVVTESLHINYTNPAFNKLFGLQPKQVKNKAFFETVKGAFSIEPLQKMLNELPVQQSEPAYLELEHALPNRAPGKLSFGVRKISMDDMPSEILITIQVLHN